MGIQTMSSHVTCDNSWLSLTLHEVEISLGNNLAKPLGSMNLDELLKKLWSTDGAHSSETNNDVRDSSAASLQRQASWSLAMAFSGKTVDEVWMDIQKGYSERGPTLGETTLEDFLVKAGMCLTLTNSDSKIEPFMSLDSAFRSQKFSPRIGLSPSPSIDASSDTPMPGRKRVSGDVEKSVERRLRRKIKNRESAARSRARKQAYHDELVTKVSYLEEEILKLKKEKQFEQMMMSCDLTEPRYQLRRTSSF
ncbi:hypothetical protein ABFS83_14G224300 [Erythranthe nasuta]